MNREQDIVQLLIDRLRELRYSRSELKTELRTPYGKAADLVVFENGMPRIVFEVKQDLSQPLTAESDTYKFDPTVRQAQLLAQELGAPYFGVATFDSTYWFEVDPTSGRPQLLSTPVLPLSPIRGEAANETDQYQVLQIMYRLADIGRGRMPSHEILMWVGIALLARLNSETGNKQLENLLINTPGQIPEFDSGLFDWALPDKQQMEAFFPEAFYVLDRQSLLTIPPHLFLEGIDALIQALNNPGRLGVFRLPQWLSDLMAHLALPQNEELVGDAYSNFGDGVAAIHRVNQESRVTSLAFNSWSYLFDKLKRAILGLEIRDLRRIRSIEDFEDSFLGINPDRVLVAPPFGQKLNSHSGRRLSSEGAFLRLALDWVIPDGIVVALVPEGFLFSKNHAAIRKQFTQEAQLHAVISLEPRLTGTTVKSSIIVLKKSTPSESDGSVIMARLREGNRRAGARAVRPGPDSGVINDLLAAYRDRNHVQSRKHTSDIWFVSKNDLDPDSWATNRYAPQDATQGETIYPTVPLQKLVHARKGSSLRIDPKGQIPVIGPGAIRPLLINPAGLDSTNPSFLTKQPALAQTGDILMHAVGTQRGATAMVTPEYEGYPVARNIIILNVTSPDVIPEYLAVALNSQYVQAQLKTFTVGSVIDQLTVGSIENVRVPVPELEVQRELIEEIATARQALEEAQQREAAIVRERQAELQRLIDSIPTGGGEDE